LLYDKITANGHLANHKYGYTSPAKPVAYAWLSSKMPDGTYEIVSRLNICKDYLQDALHNHILHGRSQVSNGYHNYNPEVKKMDKEKTRILAVCRKHERLRESIHASKRLINTIERKLGWKETVIKLAKTDEFKYEESVDKPYIVIAPNEWKGASFLLSFFTLMFRIMSGNDCPTGNNLSDVHSVIDEIRSSQYISNCQDRYIVRGNEEKIIKTALSANHIIDSLPKEILWPGHIGYEFHTNGGILSFCRRDTFSKKINAMANDLLY